MRGSLIKTETITNNKHGCSTMNSTTRRERIRSFLGAGWHATKTARGGANRSRVAATCIAVAIMSAAGLAHASWTPDNTYVALWLDADDASTITLNGANVSQWADKSGNDRHVAQSTASAQPTLASDEIQFDETDDYLWNAAPFMYDNGEIPARPFRDE